MESCGLLDTRLPCGHHSGFIAPLVCLLRHDIPSVLGLNDLSQAGFHNHSRVDQVEPAIKRPLRISAGNRPGVISLMSKEEHAQRGVRNFFGGVAIGHAMHALHKASASSGRLDMAARLSHRVHRCPR